MSVRALTIWQWYVLLVACALAGACASSRADRQRQLPAPPPPLLIAPAPATAEEHDSDRSGAENAAPREQRANERNAGSPLRLSRHEAIVRALEHNPALQVLRYDPLLAETFRSEELSVFDPYLTGSLIGDESRRQLSAVQAFTFGQGGGDNGDGNGDDEPSPARPPSLDQESLNLTTTVSKLWPTGTQLRLIGILDRSSTNFTPREYQGAWTLELTQSLLEGRRRDVNLVAVRQAENRSVQSLWQLRQAVLDTVAEVERAYWDLVQAQEVVRVHEVGVELAAEQLKISRDRVDAGREVQSAVLAAEAEHAARRADLIAARGQLRIVAARLRNLLGLGREASRPLVATQTAPSGTMDELDLAASVDRALQHRPLLATARIERANRELDELAARDALGPSLDLVAAYGRTSLGLELGDGLEHLVDSTPYDSSSIGLELSVPLSGRGERARLERTVLARRQAEAQLSASEAQVRTEVELALVAARTQLARIEASEESVRARLQELQIQQDRFEVGMARYVDVLETQRFLIQAQVASAQARAEQEKALTDLYRAEGTLLGRRAITVDSESVAGSTEAASDAAAGSAGGS